MMAATAEMSSIYIRILAISDVQFQMAVLSDYGGQVNVVGINLDLDKISWQSWTRYSEKWASANMQNKYST